MLTTHIAMVMLRWQAGQIAAGCIDCRAEIFIDMISSALKTVRA